MSGIPCVTCREPESDTISNKPGWIYFVRGSEDVLTVLSMMIRAKVYLSAENQAGQVAVGGMVSTLVLGTMLITTSVVVLVKKLS